MPHVTSWTVTLRLMAALPVLLLHAPDALRAQSSGDATVPLCGDADVYAPRGVRAYLVNYGAIGGNRMRAELAARRFVLVDEGGDADIRMMHRVTPALPVLYYRDMVALHASMPEFPALNRDETAFLHAGEPSCLTISPRGALSRLCWLPDRRVLPVKGYRLFGHGWPTGPGTMIGDSSLYRTSSAVITIPPTARFVSVATVDSTDAVLAYGRPISVTTSDLPVLPSRIHETRSDTTVTVRLDIIATGTAHPDTLALICDWDRNNTVDPYAERTLLTKDSTGWHYTRTLALPKPAESGLGGYEFHLLAITGGFATRCPATGYFSSNTNNRLKNDGYGFYVMDVASSAWRRSYRDAVLAAFRDHGYSGLFEDDTWHVVSSWAVDAAPPFEYRDSLWTAAITAMMDSVKWAIAPRPAYFNGLYDARSDVLLPHADGGMTEGFAVTHWSGLQSGASWRTLCDRGLTAQHRARRTWLALAGAHRDSTEARIYALASYLLAADTLSLYANATNYQEFAHYPEFDLPLGAPLTRADSTVEELRQGSPSLPLYVREFERGTVVVNPGTLTRPYTEVHDRPAVMLASGTTLDGGYAFTFGRGTDIPAKGARIFIGRDRPAQLASPSILTAEVLPPAVPADGHTSVTVRVRAWEESDTLFLADAGAPLRVTLDAGAIGGPRALTLTNDGTPARTLSWYEGSFTIPLGATPDSAALQVSVESTTGMLRLLHLPIRVLSADSTNLVLNYSFEIDDDDDGWPDLWRPYQQGGMRVSGAATAHGGDHAMRVRNAGKTDAGGVYARIVLNQSVPEELELSGWSKCTDVSGSPDNDYALYADLQYQDGTSLYGQTARFTTGTHDWEYSTTVITPAKPVASLTLYALFRAHTGEAWFDDLRLAPHRVPNAVEARPAIESFRIVGMHPQPCAGQVAIDLDLARPMRVQVQVMDLLGRQVEGAVARDLPMGRVVLPLQLRGLPGGVYLLRCISGDGARCAKLLVR